MRNKQIDRQTDIVTGGGKEREVASGHIVRGMFAAGRGWKVMPERNIYVGG